MSSECVKILTTLLVAFAISIAKVEVGASESDELFSLLREGDRSIRLDDNHKKFTILIGNAGAGKTTIGLLLTANQSDLEAYYDEASDKILIRDKGGRIGADVVKSKTIFPELMINLEMDAAFYDCPGFRDTRKRNASIDLANTIFIKKIADHAQAIKVVMVVNSHSVTKGGGREDFLNLLQSTLKLLKPIEKFVNSTALIATKVQHVRSPKKTVQTIANFFSDFKESLPDVLPTEEDVRRARILIDALTATTHGSYTKIHFTRVPSKEGLLSNLPEMQSDRMDIGKVIYENLEYVLVAPADFGFTFSPQAEALMARMLDKLESNAAAQLETLSTRYQQHFQALISSNPDPRNFIPIVTRAKSNLKQALEATIINPHSSAPSFVQIFMRSISDAAIDINHLAPKIIEAIEDDKKVLALVQHVADMQPKIPQALVGPIQRSVDFLQVLQDWLMLLNEIDRKLNNLGRPSTKSELNESHAVIAKQLVNESSWFQVLERLRHHCSLDILFTKEQIVRSINETTTVFHLNNIVGRIIETRWAHVGFTLGQVSSAFEQHFSNDESPQSREHLKSLDQFLSEKIDGCSSGEMVTPAEVAQELNSKFNSTFGDKTFVSIALQSLQSDQQVLNLFPDVDDKFLRRNARAVYQSMEEFKNFSTTALMWYDHVDKMASRIPVQVIPHKSSGPFFVNSQNSKNLLSQLSRQLELTLPEMHRNIPEYVKPLQRHLNQLLIEICAYSSTKISAAFSTAGEAILGNLRSRISNASSAQALLSELKYLKSNFAYQRENAFTCNGTISLENFLNEKFGAEVSNQTGCELVEKARNNIRGFCKQDSVAKLSPLMAIETLLDSTSAWYEFLQALAHSLDSYPMQRDRSLYNVANIVHWGRGGMAQGINVTTENCEAFAHQASFTIGTKHGRKAHAMCTAVSQLVSEPNGKSPLNHLNDDLLKLTLKSVPVCDFDEGNATVRGSYVKMSEALQCIHPSATQRLVILATHGFFLDTDVHAVQSNGGKPFDLIIISPDWTANATTISLEGSNAEGWSPTAANTSEPGRPGKPGGNGGNFFGLAQNISGATFSVNTNGGNGGAGQVGGTGKVGADGFRCNPCNYSFPQVSSCEGYYYGRASVNSLYGLRKIKDIGEQSEWYQFDGTRGSPGGPGGDGGIGGLGGNPGVSFLKEFCNNNGVRFYERRFCRGVDGIGGVGGPGGIGGRQQEFDLYVTKHRHDKVGSDCWYRTMYRISADIPAGNGENGVVGGNSIGLLRPPANNFDTMKILNHYASAFIAESKEQSDLFKKEQLSAFKQQLERFQFGGCIDCLC